MQILHLILQPVGLGNWLLTPRELLIERIWTQYGDGTQGVLFKSCDEHISTTPDEERSWWSWLTKPIEAYVSAFFLHISLAHLLCADSSSGIHCLPHGSFP